VHLARCADDVQASEWNNEYDEMDQQSSEIDDLHYGPRVVGKRRCTVQRTHYVANLSVLPVYGTLSMCHTNCSR